MIFTSPPVQVCEEIHSPTVLECLLFVYKICATQGVVTRRWGSEEGRRAPTVDVSMARVSKKRDFRYETS